MTHRKSKPASRVIRRDVVEEFGSAEMLAPTAALLALAAPLGKKPSANIKKALLARIRADRKQTAATPAGWRFESVRSPEGWLDAFPGIRFKPLSVDADRDVALLLLEFAPGAQFPDHPHAAGSEEILVISGSLLSAGRVLRAGDYFHADVGTDHVDVISKEGCTAMLSIRAAVWLEFRASIAA